ncbi:MAG TPA: VCBS repeat-containing protein [Acidobacteriota bacterium]|nr:VCBS repeat-containing protein [Acidobacteriota bacterium]
MYPPRSDRVVKPFGGRWALWVALALFPVLGATSGLAGQVSGGTTVAGDSAAEPATGSPEFERDVYAFEVLDAEGLPYAHPFLGGLNLPRPQLADIDGDGDLDLFVQEYTGAVMFFEQTGTPTEPHYEWRSDAYQGVDVGEWYLFVDLDEDGDLDLLGEERFSRVRMYRNEGDPTSPRFELLAETLLDDKGEEVFADRQNIPKVADLDCDGRLDLMVGRVEGTITRHEMTGLDERGAPLFRHLEDRFQGIEIIGQVLGGPTAGTRGSAGGGTRHGANTMAFVDFDNDGDLDLFWGDFFEPGLLLIENRGSCRTPSLRSEPIPFPPNDPVRTSGYNAPAFGDLDGDGDIDLLVGVLGGAFNPNNTTIDNLVHLDRTGGRRLELQTRRFLTQVDVGSESFPAFADIDDDGDLDLFLGNKIQPGDTRAGRLFFFENIGTAMRPRLQSRGPVEPFDNVYHYAPAFGDLDGDGDLDILMGSWDDELQLVRNDGSRTRPDWVVADPEIVKLTRGRNAIPALGDIDGDGDLDLFVGESSGELNLYRNVGSATEPRYELVDDKFGGIDVGRRSAPTLTDIDVDGDLDLVIGSEAEGLALFRNVGTPQAPQFEADEDFGPAVHPFATPVFADLEKDGAVDLFVGGIGGGIETYRRQ